MNKTISFSTYRSASDRIRRGEPRHMDVAICDAYDLEPAQAVVVRHWHDLPMAAAAWAEAARAVES